MKSEQLEGVAVSILAKPSRDELFYNENVVPRVFTNSE